MAPIATVHARHPEFVGGLAPSHAETYIPYLVDADAGAGAGADSFMDALIITEPFCPFPQYTSRTYLETNTRWAGRARVKRNTRSRPTPAQTIAATGTDPDPFLWPVKYCVTNLRHPADCKVWEVWPGRGGPHVRSSPAPPCDWPGLPSRQATSTPPLPKLAFACLSPSGITGEGPSQAKALRTFVAVSRFLRKPWVTQIRIRP